jgi:hypothetical protein
VRNSRNRPFQVLAGSAAAKSDQGMTHDNAAVAWGSAGVEAEEKAERGLTMLLGCRVEIAVATEEMRPRGVV